MSSLKMRLLIGLLTFCVGILFIRIYFSPTQAEKHPEEPTQSSTVAAAASNHRFERGDRDDNLQAEADALLPLFDRMLPVPVYLKDEPILKSGTNTERSVAYTNCDAHKFPSIFVKKIFYQKANRIQLVNALKHELTHAWLCRQELMSAGHDDRFRQKFKQVGGWGN